MRPSPLLAPLALVLLVAFAAVAGLVASKALPAASNARSQARLAYEHGPRWIAQGYPGAKAVEIKDAAQTPTAYSEPKVIRSHNGVLTATLRPHVGSAVINGRVYSGTQTFTGTYPGPTLVVNPGDTIKLKFINDLPGITNLHFHGFRVSPSGIADNVLRSIFPAVTSKVVAPGKSVPIVVHIPKGHEQGLYWYHPHFHGNVDAQVYPGLAGMIVVGDELKPFRWLRHITRRLMALQSVELGANGQLVPVNQARTWHETNLINGHYQPTLRIRPGELQLWRVANISNENWYKLYLDGLEFHVVDEDGNPVGHTWSQRTLLVPPAKRFEFLVRGPKAGTYKFQSLIFHQGHNNFGEFKFATVISSGKPVRPLPIPKIISRQQQGLIHDELNDKIYKRRTLTFTIKPPFPNAFYINNRLFNPNYVNEKVNLGTTEEWLLVNPSTEDHPFHIHTNDFLVEKVNGRKVQIHGFQDTVMIPHVRKNGKPGTVLIRQRYRRFQGEAVFHCHILFHEDHSMMGIIKFGPRVRNPGAGA